MVVLVDPVRLSDFDRYDIETPKTPRQLKLTLDHPQSMWLVIFTLLSIDLRNHQPEKVAQNGPKCTDRADRVMPSDVESLLWKLVGAN